MTELFDIQLLYQAFEAMAIIQIVALGLVKLMSAAFMFFGIVALAIEKDEATHSKFFKRGYGWGVSMMIVGVFLAVFEWTIRSFTQFFGASNDPLMLLSADVGSVGQLNEIDFFYLFIAAYLSLVAFFFIVGGFLAVIKASHRMEKGASVVIKYWVSGIVLIFISDYMRG